jgi:hypothetical protein
LGINFIVSCLHDLQSFLLIVNPATTLKKHCLRRTPDSVSFRLIVRVLRGETLFKCRDGALHIVLHTTDLLGLLDLLHVPCLVFVLRTLKSDTRKLLSRLRGHLLLVDHALQVLRQNNASDFLSMPN